MYTGLGRAITDWSQVSDTGLQRAEQFLPPDVVAQMQQVASASQIPDMHQMAVDAGLIPDGQAGMPLWDLVHRAIGAYTNIPAGQISFYDAMRQYPQLTALFASHVLYQDAMAFGMSVDEALAWGTQYEGQGGAYQMGTEIPADADLNQIQPYLQWLNTYTRQVFDDATTAAANTQAKRDTLVYQVVETARQAALSRGATVLGNGVTVATGLIVEQVELPDGVMYAVVDDVTRDPADRMVYRWLGPKYRAFQAANSYTRNGVTICEGVVKGTGNWYEQGAYGLHGDASCDATPDGFDGDYSLITADMAAAVATQGGAPVTLVHHDATPTGGQTTPTPQYVTPPTVTHPVLLTPTIPVTQPVNPVEQQVVIDRAHDQPAGSGYVQPVVTHTEFQPSPLMWGAIAAVALLALSGRK